MKLIFTLAFVTLAVCFISLAEAMPKQRQKRAVLLEKCPEDSTLDECTAYAVKNSKDINYCYTFDVSDDWIQWQSCGVVACGDNLKFVEEDLSKPYPKCCSTCMRI